MFTKLMDYVLPNKTESQPQGRFGTPTTAESTLRYYSELLLPLAEETHNAITAFRSGHDISHHLEQIGSGVTTWYQRRPRIDTGAFSEVDCTAQNSWTTGALDDYKARVDGLAEKLEEASDILEMARSTDQGVSWPRPLQDSVDIVQNTCLAQTIRLLNELSTQAQTCRDIIATTSAT